MCRRGQTVMFNGVEYRLTLKGRLYAEWFIIIDRLKRLALKLKRKEAEK